MSCLATRHEVVVIWGMGFGNGRTWNMVLKPGFCIWNQILKMFDRCSPGLHAWFLLKTNFKIWIPKTTPPVFPFKFEGFHPNTPDVFIEKMNPTYFKVSYLKKLLWCYPNSIRQSQRKIDFEFRQPNNVKKTKFKIWRHGKEINCHLILKFNSTVNIPQFSLWASNAPWENHEWKRDNKF